MSKISSYLSVNGMWSIRPQVQSKGHALMSVTPLKWCGFCVQVNLPVATVDGCPVGLGLIGPRRSDEDLLRLAEELEPILCGP